jgi:hypothetical protein
MKPEIMAELQSISNTELNSAGGIIQLKKISMELRSRILRYIRNHHQQTVVKTCFDSCNVLVRDVLHKGVFLLLRIVNLHP